MNDCPFCDMPKDRVIAEYEFWYVIYDGFPVNKGHTLIILKHHNPNFFEIGALEMAELRQILTETKTNLDVRYSPDGYNVGVNVGEASGQTIPHVHVHVIPRYEGDCENPRGGVRKVKPPLVEY